MAIQRMGISARVVRLDEMKRYALAALPGLVILEQLVCAGRIPLALGVMRVARGLNVLARLEPTMRQGAALIFVAIGMYTVWTWLSSAV